MIKKKFIEKIKVSTKEVSKKESGFWKIKAFNIAKIIYNNSQRNPLKSLRSFFPKNFKEGTAKERKAVLLDATKVYDGRTKIIRLFENSSIKPSNYPHNVKFEPDEHNIEGKFEPKEYDGVKNSIGERTKSGKQKYNKLDKIIIVNDKIIKQRIIQKLFF